MSLKAVEPESKRVFRVHISSGSSSGLNSNPVEAQVDSEIQADADCGSASECWWLNLLVEMTVP